MWAFTWWLVRKALLWLCCLLSALVSIFVTGQYLKCPVFDNNSLLGCNKYLLVAKICMAVCWANRLPVDGCTLLRSWGKHLLCIVLSSAALLCGCLYVSLLWWSLQAPSIKGPLYAEFALYYIWSLVPRYLVPSAFLEFLGRPTPVFIATGFTAFYTATGVLLATSTAPQVQPISVRTRLAQTSGLLHTELPWCKAWLGVEVQPPIPHPVKPMTAPPLAAHVLTWLWQSSLNWIAHRQPAPDAAAKDLTSSTPQHASTSLPTRQPNLPATAQRAGHLFKSQHGNAPPTLKPHSISSAPQHAGVYRSAYVSNMQLLPRLVLRVANLSSRPILAGPAVSSLHTSSVAGPAAWSHHMARHGAKRVHQETAGYDITVTAAENVVAASAAKNVQESLTQESCSVIQAGVEEQNLIPATPSHLMRKSSSLKTSWDKLVSVKNKTAKKGQAMATYVKKKSLRRSTSKDAGPPLTTTSSLNPIPTAGAFSRRQSSLRRTASLVKEKITPAACLGRSGVQV